MVFSVYRRLSYTSAHKYSWFIGNSLERLQQYMIIEQEPQPVEDRQPPAYWPSSGALKVENLSARYSPVRSDMFLFGLEGPNIHLSFRMVLRYYIISPSRSRPENVSVSSDVPVAGRVP